MSSIGIDGNNNEVQTESAHGEILQLFLDLLVQPRIKELDEIPEGIRNEPAFQKVYAHILDLRELSGALNKGDLHKFVYTKGHILSNLKALQSNLRHLTWQTQKVADGDFSQKVDFLGEFSDSFNEMTIKLRDSSAQLHKLASMDVLTQVPNRLTLERFLSDSFSDAKDSGKDFSILIMDIDHFKKVNDTYGHDVGDKVLVKVSEVLNKQFRASDVFARYGGEEFVAGLPGANLKIANQIAERARKAVEATPVKVGEDVSVPVTVSIGVSEICEGDVSYDEIIKRSDTALYEAKNTGRNKVCVLKG